MVQVARMDAQKVELARVETVRIDTRMAELVRVETPKVLACGIT